MLSYSFFVVVGFAASAVVLGWAYFRRYQLQRPPVGVFTLGDVAVMMGAIILLPFLYLHLPLWFLTGFFTLVMLSILHLTAQPVLRIRTAVWLTALVLVGADIGTKLEFGGTSAPFLAVNNSLLVLTVIGVTNLWAQSGMKARDTTLLAGALAVYDLIATSLLPLMTDLLNHLTHIPFTPLVAWGIGGGDGLGIGVGDLLLATVYPLVVRKAFGRSAGITAMALSLATIAAVLALIELDIVNVTLPVMTALGPLMVAHYGYWIRRRGQERTTWQYLQAESADGHIVATDQGVR
jgi:hypothetical protein